MAIRKVAVIGGGTMGSGIAHVFALAGYEVKLVEAAKDLLDRAVKNIEGNLSRQAAKSVITAEQKAKALSLLKPCLGLESASDCDLAVEAVPELLALKKDVFSRLDSICPAHAILATNTSSLPVTSLAAATRRPDKVIGMHFMNPVP
ncbi:MAG: NAD-binding protein, partial [Elusimicrobia bacterium]|nr:NAD-binding protein [Elusimicrobiota bacterium]